MVLDVYNILPRSVYIGLGYIHIYIPGLRTPSVERHVRHVVEELSRRQAMTETLQSLLQLGMSERFMV